MPALEQPNMVEERASFIDALADEFLQRHRRGERPRIAQYIERYPEHADEIRELLPSLVMLESLATGKDQRSRYSLLSGIRRPEILGDYRILQEVGQGGMGIVYEAEQISLGRHVALKILPFQLAGNPRAVERFQREARAAANLQHPHIVPVFDFGQEDAVWYYAMQFVHGQPLSEVLEEVRKLQGGETIDLARWAGQTTDLAVTLLEGGAEGDEEGPVAEATHVDHQPFDAPAWLGTEREVRLRRIIDDCLERSERGEPIAEEEIIRRHGDLQPELGEELRMLRLVQASRLPSFVEDLAAMEAKWALPHEEEEPPVEKDSGDKCSDANHKEFRASSAVSLTGKQDLTPAGRKRFYFQSVARLGVEVAGALAYAHEQGVIHRDIKPSNLMLDTRGQVWVTDFGLAKLEGGNCTTSQGFVGTLRYMSPEQIHGRCDERSDVYGLGMTLYEMITLTLPFEDLEHLDVIHHVCHEGPVPPRDLDPAIPRDLETIVLKAIARHASDRYQSARELADDLVRFLEHKPIAAKRSGRLMHVWKWVERNRASVALLGLALMLIAVLASGTLRSNGVAQPGSEKGQALEQRILELEEQIVQKETEIDDLQQRLAETQLSPDPPGGPSSPRAAPAE